jgi:hypothetical protein
LLVQRSLLPADARKLRGSSVCDAAFFFYCAVDGSDELIRALSPLREYAQRSGWTLICFNCGNGRAQQPLGVGKPPQIEACQRRSLFGTLDEPHGVDGATKSVIAPGLKKARGIFDKSKLRAGPRPVAEPGTQGEDRLAARLRCGKAGDSVNDGREF